MHRTILFLAHYPLALPAGVFMTIPERADQLLGRIETRREALDSLPAPTPGEVKEAKALLEAKDTLDGYAGTEEPKDLAVIAKTLSAIYKAASPDNLLNGECQQMVFSFRSHATGQKSPAEVALARITSAAGQAKVQAAIDKAQAVCDSSDALEDHGKAAKILLKGAAGFRKALATAEKVLDKEILASVALECSFPEVPDFAAEEDSVTASYGAGGVFLVTGRLPGHPQYTIMLAIDTPADRGVYPLRPAESWILKKDGDKEATWYAVSGTLSIDVLTERAISGTFGFSTDSGFDVTGGVVRAGIE